MAAATEVAVGQRQSEIVALEEKLAGLRAQAEISEEAETAASDRKEEAGRRIEEARNSPGAAALESRIRERLPRSGRQRTEVARGSQGA